MPAGRIVRATGELDAAAMGTLQRRLARAAAGAERVVLDLRRVDFIDGIAALTLLDVDRRLRAAAKRLVVVRGSWEAQWSLELADTQHQLTFVDAPSG